MAIEQRNEVVRIPFAGQPSFRKEAITKDQLYLNCMVEVLKNPASDSSRVYLYKRPGLSQVWSLTAGDSRGCMFWGAAGKFYSCIGNTLYSNNTSILTLTTSTGNVGFTECFTGSGYRLFVCDGTKAWLVSPTDVVTEINVTNFPDDGSGNSGANLPTPHIPQPIFFDGYVFLIDTANRRVWNSKVSDPGRWGSSSFVTPIIFGDQAVGMARQANQLVVFKESTTEMYYNAGLAPPGSPLGRTEQAVIQVGCVSPYAISGNEKFVMWLGKSHAGEAAVWLLDGFTPRRVSIEPIERLLAQETSLDSAVAFITRVGGHFMYVLCVSDYTIVYDIDEQFWTLWGSSETTPTSFNYGDEFSDGQFYVLHKTNGKVLHLDPNTYTDDGSTFPVIIRTSLIDHDNNYRKQCYRATVIGDRQPTTSPVLLQWSDDDYQTYNTGHTLDMANPRAFTPKCGNYRRRSWKVTHNHDSAFRAEALEVYYKQGTN